MKPINRLMTNICSENLGESKHFYTTLFDFQINYDSDWFIHLMSINQQLELGIIDKKNDLVPASFQKEPNGFYLTFVVDNAEELFEIAKQNSFTIVNEPIDTDYGQRRLLLKDPDGTLVDVSSPIPNFSFQ